MKHHFFGETVNGEACRKLADDMQDGSTFIKKQRIPLATFHSLYFGLCEIWKNGRTETINEQAASIYKKYGFIVEPHGIGWSVS